MVGIVKRNILHLENHHQNYAEFTIRFSIYVDFF